MNRVTNNINIEYCFRCYTVYLFKKKNNSTTTTTSIYKKKKKKLTNKHITINGKSKREKPATTTHAI